MTYQYSPYSPELSFYASTDSLACPGPSSSGYFPPPSVWGAQRASQVDLSLKTPESEVPPTPAPAQKSKAYAYHFSTLLPPSPDSLGFSPALPESPAVLPPTPASAGPVGASFTGDQWPVAPRRVRNLNRKLPPSLTESLEALVRIGHQQHEEREQRESLEAVPEHSPTRPLRSPLRPQGPVRASTLSQLQALQPRRSASISHETDSRPYGLPRSPSMPSVPTRSRTLSKAVPSHMSRNASCSSSTTNSSNEWIVTPQHSVRVLPTLPEPVEFIASQADVRRERALIAAAAVDEFEPFRPVDVSKLLYASELDVVAEDGNKVRFGDLVSGSKRTVVVFVRHWLSTYCAQYIKALMARFTPEVLEASRARVVLIGHGSADMIKGYRAHFACPFKVYTDPSRRLHDTLGLLARPIRAPQKGDYIVQNAVIRAVERLRMAARMHGFRSGDRHQLGGECIFDGSLNLLFSHRMAGVCDHASVTDLVNVTTSRRRPTLYQSTRASRSCMTLSLPSRVSEDSHLRAVSEESSSSSSEATMDFPCPPLRVTEQDCVRWDEQRASRISQRSKTRLPYSYSQIDLHHDDIDAVTGEVVIGRAI